ncbi:MAG TPA: EamA family transporter [Bryobacteraceae bacterium]|nr:EamA family transporter [Bryobacteraceae bacterium]
MRRHPLFKPYLALVAVCFLWGTTYLGIRMALETFPPFTLVSVRYIISGTLTLMFGLAKGMHMPRGRDLAVACFSGLLVLGVGNGTLALAETMIASGLAGLILTMQPFWFVGFEALLPGGERLHGPTVGAMALGLAGACLLVLPDLGPNAANHNKLTGMMVLGIGMAGWCFGSIYQRRKSGLAHPVIAGGVQQLAAGLALVPLAAAVPHPVYWSARGVGALFYLVIFGSLAGYSAYVYAMDRLPVAIVSIYPYINAVVAVTLGWLFYREPFGLREALATVVIFVAVTLVKRFSRRAAG